ncbi:MAG: thioredoxin fold domain-containing protein [Balneolaceae bacterium]
MKFRSALLISTILLLSSTLSFAQDQADFNSGFEWVTLADAQVQAKESGKKILLFGFAEWCTYCLKTRKETFPDSTVLASISNYYIPVQLDGESDTEIEFNGQTLKENELARYLRLTSFPTHYFIDSEGEILGAQPGFIEPDIYTPLLDFVGTDSHKKMSFEEFFEKGGY